jgi:hypothetical protein
MGFFDTLNSVGNSVCSKALEQWAAMCKKATDDKLLEWWDAKQFDPEVDQRLKDVAEKELRRRHLI